MRLFVFVMLVLSVLPRAGRAAVRCEASSVQNKSHAAALVCDGDPATRRSSGFADQQWLTLDLGEVRPVTGLVLRWEAAFGRSYDILTSRDGSEWRRAYTTSEGDGGTDDISFARAACRYVKFLGKERGTPWGYSLWEAAVKGPEDEIAVSASAGGSGASNVLDGDPATRWHSGSGRGDPWIAFTAAKTLHCGSIEILWGNERPAAYAVDITKDNKHWKTVRSVQRGDGERDTVPLNLSGARSLKITCRRSDTATMDYTISDIRFKSWKETAAKSGLDTARSIVGWEGCEWVTFTGRDGSFAPEPHPYQVNFWLSRDGGETLYTPETLPVEWKLKDGRYPVPITRWQAGDITVVTTLFARFVPALNRMVTFARASVENRGDSGTACSLHVLLRQNPLCGKWNTNLSSLRLDDDMLVRVNGKAALYPAQPPSREQQLPQLAKDVFAAEPLARGRELAIDGPEKAGALTYRMELRAGETKHFDLFALSGEEGEPPAEELRSLSFPEHLAAVEEHWKNRTDLVVELPDREYADCLYSSLSYILLTMKGDGLLFPGPYAYKSFFLHDTVEMAGALDKAGIHDVARRATKHYRTHEVAGYVDELGGSVFGYYEHYRLTGDLSFLRASFPKMVEGCRLIRKMRSEQLKPEFRETPYYGLMPKSVSQDNFKIPAYLYVDDWWSVLGLKAAADAAALLGDGENRAWIEQEYRDLFDCTLASIRKVMAQEGFEHMPAFADYWPPEMRIVDADHRILGDTQMAWAHRPALFPGLTLGLPVPMDLFERSYRKYWETSGRFSNYDGGWYVEYEQLFWGYNVQLAHPLLFLGMEDTALKNLAWSLRNQSCPGAWAEAMYTRVNRDGFREVAEGIVGDVPHGWTAGYYVLLVRNMLLREEGERLILLSAVPGSWLEEGRRISVRNAPTYFGTVGFSVERAGKTVTLRLETQTPPPGGFEIRLPEGYAVSALEIDGTKQGGSGARSVTVPPRAKTVLIHL